MSPTLKNGQFILMEKFNGDLKRDQIIILPDPDPVPTTNPNPSIKNIIKRIKFIPGDKYYLLQYYDNVDTSCQTSFIKSDLLNVKGANKDNSNIQQCFIYKGETFIEGDNKYLSSDSRSFGPIEIKDIKYVYVATL
jgi:signal peptidase I